MTLNIPKAGDEVLYFFRQAPDEWDGPHYGAIVAVRQVIAKYNGKDETYFVVSVSYQNFWTREWQNAIGRMAASRSEGIERNFDSFVVPRGPHAPPLTSD